MGKNIHQSRCKGAKLIGPNGKVREAEIKKSPFFQPRLRLRRVVVGGNCPVPSRSSTPVSSISNSSAGSAESDKTDSGIDNSTGKKSSSPMAKRAPFVKLIKCDDNDASFEKASVSAKRPCEKKFVNCNGDLTAAAATGPSNSKKRKVQE